MDHRTLGRHSQPSNSSSFQWLSFAYQGLTEIPYETILMHKDTLLVLDLSYNLLDEYPFALQGANDESVIGGTGCMLSFCVICLVNAHYGLTNILCKLGTEDSS